MNSFNEIIERIKDILSQDIPSRYILDKDVARELGMKPMTFATMKCRGIIPFREIMLFCAKRRININWMFFDQSVDMLVGGMGIELKRRVYLKKEEISNEKR